MEFGKVGFWREGKTGTPREKPLGKEENQQQTYPFIYLKHEKGTPFSRSLPRKAITPSPTPREREASDLTTVPLMLTFRQKPIHVLYLLKKVGSFMSISLINKNHFAKFVPVHFLIQAKKVSTKIRYEKKSKYKRTHGWTNMKKIEIDYNCVVFNSWVRASVPRVIAGTRIYK